jgi:cysteine-rich CPXCG protein
MTRRRLPSAQRASSPDASTIDALYGLEPIFELGRALDRAPGGANTGGTKAGDTTPAVQVECPYCGEPFTTVLDLSTGSASYIEDCYICCQPIEFDVVVSLEGALDSLELRRTD